MRLLQTGFILILALVLAACGGTDDTNNQNDGANGANDGQEQTNENGQGDTEPQDDTQGQADDTAQNNADNNDNNTATSETPYGFTDFSFEADLDTTAEYIDVDYEYEPNEIEASYRDQENDISLTGEEALQELDSIFQSFTFDENTEDEEVLNEVLELFNVPENATNIELDIDFQSGTEKEYHR